MGRALGFDREKYIELQSEHINARRKDIGGKLYLETVSYTHLTLPTSDPV